MRFLENYNKYRKEKDISMIPTSCHASFNYEFLISKDELLKSKDELTKYLSNKEENDKLNPFKRKLTINKLNIMYLIEDYYNFFESMFRDMKVYRYVGKAMTKDMIEYSNQVKATKFKSLADTYGFDGGIVRYWVFTDAVVFQTSKRKELKIR